ncbi:hypothetical protein [Vibrio phage VCPH]|nr:hypothetical protein [Vibrio phage VCPH]
MSVPKPPKMPKPPPIRRIGVATKAENHTLTAIVTIVGALVVFGYGVFIGLHL